jgi:hypothetical protein
MPRQLITANRLIDGEVVYLTPDGGWSERIQDAASDDDADIQARLLARGEAAERALEVVGAYLMPVALEAGRLIPLSQREWIRALGPTVRQDLGKQAAVGA